MRTTPNFAPSLLLMIILAASVWWTTRASTSEAPATDRVRATLCLGEHEDALRVGSCMQGRVSTPPSRMRRALGIPVCWSDAEHHDMMQVSGVGEEIAVRLVDYRDAGGTLRARDLVSIRGVGDATAGRLLRAFDNTCAPSSHDMPSGRPPP